VATLQTNARNDPEISILFTMLLSASNRKPDSKTNKINIYQELQLRSWHSDVIMGTGYFPLSPSFLSTVLGIEPRASGTRQVLYH
jgi:hypothetical protein